MRVLRFAGICEDGAQVRAGVRGMQRSATPKDRWLAAAHGRCHRSVSQARAEAFVGGKNTGDQGRARAHFKRRLCAGTGSSAPLQSGWFF